MAASSLPSSSSSSTTTTPCTLRVSNPRPTTNPARDWASLPPSLLQKVFRKLEVSDLENAKETCAQWKYAVPGGGGADPAPAAAPDVVHTLPESWNIRFIETIVELVQEIREHQRAAADALLQSDVKEDLEGLTL